MTPINSPRNLPNHPACLPKSAILCHFTKKLYVLSCNLFYFHDLAHPCSSPLDARVSYDRFPFFVQGRGASGSVCEACNPLRSARESFVILLDFASAAHHSRPRLYLDGNDIRYSTIASVSSGGKL